MAMTGPLRVGQQLFGDCRAIFGWQSRGVRRVEAVGRDWVVARAEAGHLEFASTSGHAAIETLFEDSDLDRAALRDAICRGPSPSCAECDAAVDDDGCCTGAWPESHETGWVRCDWGCCDMGRVDDGEEARDCPRCGGEGIVPKPVGAGG